MKTSWIIYFMAVGFGLYETAYFGWHWFPSNPSEVICDGITAVLFALALRREPTKPNAPHEGPGGFSPGPLDAVVGRQREG